MKAPSSLFIFILLFFGNAVQAQVNPVTLDYFLPDNVTYNSEIPTPQEILGAELGEWHVRHDQLVNYMYAVAEASDRVSIEEIGRTYENRPLLVLAITSPQNHRNLEQIRQQHLKLTNAAESGSLDLSTMPIVISMNYSVHGNEPSGSNASLAVVYYLAAGQGAEINNLLENTVILIDPSINPDGLSRFAHWANTNKSLNNLVTDPNSREFSEPWPGGRTNHYWFDLNRDWMPMIHPSSQARVAKFHEWKPQVLTDHHEMGKNSTFFFQPGVPSRTHPLTPQRNQNLTGAIAEYHAEALDEIQSLYYSEEDFDDFYYGKGSTYPDVNGSVGILFEQASSRGHAQENNFGVIEFPFTIRNQFVTSLSTLEAGLSLKEELLANTREFYREAAEEARSANIKAYVFGEETDQARTNHLAEMLTRNQIEVYELSRDVQNHKAGKSYVVPTNQQQFKLLTALFERRTEFSDSLFYDVSAFTLPYAFNLPFTELNGRAFNQNILGEPFSLDKVLPEGKVVGGESKYAYAFEWDEYYAPRALYKLLSSGIKARVASRQFTSVTEEGAKEFDYGTILIPVGGQENQEQLHTLIQEVSTEDGLTVYNLETGLTARGVDLGSNNMANLTEPKVAFIGGSGTNSYEIGEAWHLLDQRYKMPVSMLDSDNLGRTNLDRYNVIATSAYSLSESAIENLKSWVSDGGTLLVYRSALRWAKQSGLAKFDYITNENNDNAEREVRPYVNQRNDRGAHVIGGAIFNAKLDLTHPLAYGYNQEDITVFRGGTTFLQKGENPYSTPLYYTESPLAAGYISDENLERIAGSAAIVVSSHGRGNVIAMADNPNFRAFWYGTNKLFANAIFFGNTISRGTTN